MANITGMEENDKLRLWLLVIVGVGTYILILRTPRPDSASFQSLENLAKSIEENICLHFL